MTHVTIAKKMGRFWQKPWPEKLEVFLDRTFYRLTLPLVYPMQLPFGAWILAWPDVMGQNFRRGGYEEQEQLFIERFLKPDMIVLDVGAHVGFYTLLASRQVRDRGFVVAFEPSLRERRRLRWNLAMNRCRNVRVESLALGDYNGQADFYVVLGKETGCNSIRPPSINDPIRRITVPVMTLDNYLSQSQIRAVDLIKLDVEGAELAVLKGASGLLAKQPRPVFMCELEDLRTEPWNYKARETYEFLSEAGFSWFSVRPGGDLQPALKKSDFHENLVAVPGERLSEVEDLVRQE